jgi:hypothetical protein
LKKHFNELLIQYMFNYFFELNQGFMNMRLLNLALNSLDVYIPLIKASSLDLIKISILSDLFDTGIFTI